MRIGFACTNFNNSSFTRAAVESLHAGGQGDAVSIVVVDNGSRPDDLQALADVAREFPTVDVVLSRENVGYFPGLNVGIRRLRERAPDAEVLVVGNNDLTFPAGFVETVRRNRDIFDEHAVVAPDLVTPDGVHQNPHVLRPIGRTRRLMWDIYHSSYGAAVALGWAARATRRFTVREENAPGSELYKTAGPVEQGYGACYLLGPAFFKHFDGLAAPTFMMQEEFFLSEQLKSIGQMTWYDPRFVVQHHTHATMGTIPARRRWALARDAHRIYKRYLGAPSAERRRMLEERRGEGRA